MGNPLIAAIDPGAMGAFAWFDKNGFTQTEYMPDDIEDLIGMMRSIRDFNEGIEFYVEQVGTYMPGNSGPAAVKFARHCGHLDAALIALGIPHKFVRPQKWMEWVGLPKFGRIHPSITGLEKKRELDRRKQIRKNAIKEAVQLKFPLIKVTLKNSDALGILHWASIQKASELGL